VLAVDRGEGSEIEAGRKNKQRSEGWDGSTRTDYPSVNIVFTTKSVSSLSSGEL
jgi:hypothetical protein